MTLNPFADEAMTRDGHIIPQEIKDYIISFCEGEDWLVLCHVSSSTYSLALNANSYYQKAQKNSSYKTITDLHRGLKNEEAAALASVGLTRNQILQEKAILEAESLCERTFIDCSSSNATFEEYSKRFREINLRLIRKCTTHNKWLYQAIKKDNRQALLYVLENQFSFSRLYLPSDFKCFTNRNHWRESRNISLGYSRGVYQQENKQAAEFYKLFNQFKGHLNTLGTPLDQDQVLAVLIKAVDLSQDKNLTQNIVTLCDRNAHEDWRFHLYLSQLHALGKKENSSKKRALIAINKKKAKEYLYKASSLMSSLTDRMEKANAFYLVGTAMLIRAFSKIDDWNSQDIASFTSPLREFSGYLQQAIEEWEQEGLYDSSALAVKQMFEAFLQSPFGWVHPLMRPGSININIYHSLFPPTEHLIVMAPLPYHVNLCVRGPVLHSVVKAYAQIRAKNENTPLPSLTHILDPLTFVIGTGGAAKNYYYLVAFLALREVDPIKYEPILNNLFSTLDDDSHGQSLKLVFDKPPTNGYYDKFLAKAQDYLKGLSKSNNL